MLATSSSAFDDTGRYLRMPFMHSLHVCGSKYVHRITNGALSIEEPVEVLQPSQGIPAQGGRSRRQGPSTAIRLLPLAAKPVQERDVSRL